jgi:hypothetical protein
MEHAKGPQFMRFCIPIVETLKALGGSGKAKGKRSRGRCAKDLRGRDGDAYNAGA